MWECTPQCCVTGSSSCGGRSDLRKEQVDFPDGSFDCVISFQVIEHIRRDEEFVREVSRVLRKGGVFVVSTPNAPMSLTRNPWHVREYTATQLTRLLRGSFSEVECRGVFGNDRVMEYYAANKAGCSGIYIICGTDKF